ncbi:MAG TPA: universal stress protein [Nevskiaceae bacterium]|nr:universal stress protein [Nevskiaceae bacterium]
MRYVIGYTPNEQGRSAINLAATLARPRGASLDIVVVLPQPGGNYESLSWDDPDGAELEKRGREWLEMAKHGVPPGIRATGRLYRAESVAQGLIDAATDPTLGAWAELIAVGTTTGSVRGRFTVGGVAAALLHAAPVPVGLVPLGCQNYPGISRITVAIGTRQGAEVLLDVAADSVAGRHIPLRFLSLAALDTAQFVESKASLKRADEYVGRLLERAHQVLPPQCPVTRVEGHGHHVDDVVENLAFQDDEIVLVGSSRLAGSNSLFIGAAAHKLLRVLPVPMIVVPRDYRVPSQRSNVVAWTVGDAS